MRKPMRPAAIALSLTLLFSSCIPLPSNTQEPTTAETTAHSETTAPQSQLPEVFRLCYSSKDSMNPFKTTGITNRALIPLLYDPLFFINESFEAVPVLAEEYSMDGREVSVTLKSGVEFSNGSTLNSSDVYTSCKQAQKSEMYKKKLENIDKITIESDLSLTFHLKENDIFFINTLDFPITDNATADEHHPAGTGAYRFLNNDDGAVLSANESSLHSAPELGQIPLTDVPEGGAIVNSLETGNISFLFDELSEGSSKRINAATRTVPMNNLVFLGVNVSRFDPSFRQGVSYALSRKDIVTDGLQGNAVAATGPFHPNWKKAENVQSMEIVADINKAEAAFAATETPKTSFKLLINDENAFRKDTAEEIKNQLAEFGIDVEIVTKRWEEYINTLANGNYDFFLGEIRISSNMDLTPLLSGGTQESPTGVRVSQAVKESYNDYRSGTVRLDEFLSVFNNSMPFIPLCYRSGIIAYTRSLTGEMHPSQNNVFFGIEGWRLQKPQ